MPRWRRPLTSPPTAPWEAVVLRWFSRLAARGTSRAGPVTPTVGSKRSRCNLGGDRSCHGQPAVVLQDQELPSAVVCPLLLGPFGGEAFTTEPARAARAQSSVRRGGARP